MATVGASTGITTRPFPVPDSSAGALKDAAEAKHFLLNQTNRISRATRGRTLFIQGGCRLALHVPSFRTSKACRQSPPDHLRRAHSKGTPSTTGQRSRS